MTLLKKTLQLSSHHLPDVPQNAISPSHDSLPKWLPKAKPRTKKASSRTLACPVNDGPKGGHQREIREMSWDL
jgi:hypothetical protein